MEYSYAPEEVAQERVIRGLDDDELRKLLNGPQFEAVCHDKGPLLILAGAGSGKTRVITYRIARLIRDGVSAYRIIALTFTNKAAKEMKERTRSLLGLGNTDVWISTFHSACLRILRRDADKIGYSKEFAVYDSQDQERLIKTCLAELNIDEKENPARQIGSMISRFKNRLEGPAHAEKELNPRRFESFLKTFALYEKKLRESGCMDFDDLMGKTVELLRNHEDVRMRYQNRFLHIMVDEFQDTNVAQYEMIRLLMGDHQNICVVGDDDQSIYQWRGANIGNILNFEKDYPNAKVILLEQNYRSTQNILDGAFAVVRRNPVRMDKKLWTQNSVGEKINLYYAHDEMDEAKFITDTLRKLMKTEARSLNDVAIFYRTNSQSRAIEDVLRREGFRYQVYGGLKFYERKEVKDILAYFRAALNSLDTISFRRVINTPPRGIGNVTIDKLAVAASESGLPLSAILDDLDNIGGINSGTKSKLSDFRELMSRLRYSAINNTASDAINDALTLTGYMDYLAKEDDSEAVSRMENLTELVSAARDFELQSGETSIMAFLDQAALVADADAVDEGSGSVRMMTVHISKGLEFPVVFVTGLEENIFPHARSKDDPAQMQEERRLMYVAMTRARERLYLTCAQTRRVFGTSQANAPSMFIEEMLADLPKTAVETEEPREKTYYGYGESAYSRPEKYNTYKPKTITMIPAPAPKPVAKKPAQQGLDFTGVSASASTSKGGELAVGMKVRHPSFQVGIVRNIDGHGDNGKITVYFPRFGEKKLVRKFAKLEIV